jgi:hypothetical protein
MPLAALAEPAPAPMAPTKPAAHMHHRAAMMHQETVDQRISMLHAALKIDSAEEPQWSAVAQAMRDSEANMQRLTAETKARPHPLSAVDDLKTYERFTQAHVDGLKTVISSFQTLYDAMPDSQKALADQVFHKFGAKGPPHAS